MIIKLIYNYMYKVTKERRFLMVNNRLKIMRKATGYTQTRLAGLVNVAQNTYSDWETGRKKIHDENIKKLAEIYKVSIDFLLGREFKVTRPVECWTQSEQQEYYTSNEYKKVYLEYLWGSPIFTGDTSAESAKILHVASSLSEHEQLVINAYRSLPHMQAAVDTLLGISSAEGETVYAAAKSSDNHPPRVIFKTQKDWDIIANAPETDEPLK